MRRSGILLAISSLPGKYGIGTFGKAAYDFVDFLYYSGQSLWQILPLGPTGYGDSPYQSFSAFAGNPYYIDMEEFIQNGWLTDKECSKYDYGHPEYVEYGTIYKAKFALLRKAFKKSNIESNKDFAEFKKNNSEWLKDYAMYMAIKDSLKSVAWTEWPQDIKMRKASALKKYEKELEQDINFYCFQQYYFDKQWKALKQYANKKGVQIVGDIPIYVAMDSADTWSNPKLYELDKDCNPVNVAGCPPDAFSETGQLWGNPLYRWDYHKSTGYDWWMKRLKHCFELYDVVRIDHFRGFDEYYSIPYGETTAVNGEWRPGPGYDLFAVMKATMGKKQVIAEDLGFLTDSVIKMVKKTGFPGMKILQFAFNPDWESTYLPHNYPTNCVVYTGTHDNDTTRHWFDTLSKGDKNHCKKYLMIKSAKEATRKMVLATMASVADTCITPLQDWMELDGEARMNTPSTLGTNWKWRLNPDMLTEDLAAYILEQTKLYNRLVK